MTKTALIIDDSPTMRSMVKVTMEQQEGFECVTAQDGEKALKLAKTHDFDVIITDINMPNMDGITFIREVRKLSNHKYTPILALTTEGGSDTKGKGKDAGASGWIVKPFKPEVLSNAVRKVCGL